MIAENIFGLKANVYLKWDNGINELSHKLVKGLMIPDFSFDHEDEPPYLLVGSLEVLGCELWLNPSERIDSYPYCLRLETELSFDESFNDRMHDISSWLARYISMVCEIDCCIFDIASKTYFLHSEGKWSTSSG